MQWCSVEDKEKRATNIRKARRGASFSVAVTHGRGSTTQCCQRYGAVCSKGQAKVPCSKAIGDKLRDLWWGTHDRKDPRLETERPCGGRRAVRVPQVDTCWWCEESKEAEETLQGRASFELVSGSVSVVMCDIAIYC